MPREGGLENQVIGYVDRMAWASNTYRACKGFTEAPKVADWIKHNPDLKDLYDYAIDLLAEDGLA